MTRIAIIGSGITGLSLAHLLQADAEVTVFEKTRTLGGRMASRRTERWHFDHGAQFFTARHPGFRKFLAPYLDAGLVQEWKPRVTTLSPDGRPYRRGWFEPHYVGVPTMASLARSLAAPLAVVLQHDVRAIERRGSGEEWFLRFADGQYSEPFDWVVSTTPAPMAAQLMPGQFTALPDLRAVRYAPCFCLMLGFDEPLSLPWDAARVRESTLGWIVRGKSRPGRPRSETLLLHSNHRWALAHADQALPQAMVALEAAARELPGLRDLPEPASRQLHRWRYAELLQPSAQPAYVDHDHKLAAAGDWGLRGDVESAWLCANALHEAMRGAIEPGGHVRMRSRQGRV